MYPEKNSITVPPENLERKNFSGGFRALPEKISLQPILRRILHHYRRSRRIGPENSRCPPNMYARCCHGTIDSITYPNCDPLNEPTLANPHSILHEPFQGASSLPKCQISTVCTLLGSVGTLWS